LGWQSKKLQMQGAQIMGNEAYIWVCRNDEGCGATQQMNLLTSHQDLLSSVKSKGVFGLQFLPTEMILSVSFSCVDPGGRK